MTDLSPERLEKLLEQASKGAWAKHQGEFAEAVAATDKLAALAPALARQRIADAKRIAELGAVTTKQDMIEELEGRIEALPDTEEKDLDLKYLLQLILDLLR